MNDRISYTARAAVGIAGMLLIGLLIPLALLAFSCAFLWLWDALGLPA